MRRTKRVNIPISQNADFSVNIYVPSGGVATDLTGFVFESVMKSSTDTTQPPVASFSFIILDQTNPLTKGKVNWFMGHNITKNIPVSLMTSESDQFLDTRYLYDVFMIDPGGIRTRILAGKVFVSPEVT